MNSSHPTPRSGAVPIRVDLPPRPEVLASLVAGDEVRLFGPVFTARDATHARLLQEVAATGALPYDLTGQVLFYAGPTPPRAGKALGSVGPTSAYRMDAATAPLLAHGIAATFGKGQRSKAVAEACARHGAVFFGAVGGAAALLANHVTAAETVAYPELGTEALVRLELDDFPAFVAIDTQGVDIYDVGPATWRERHATEEAPRG